MTPLPQPLFSARGTPYTLVNSIFLFSFCLTFIGIVAFVADSLLNCELDSFLSGRFACLNCSGLSRSNSQLVPPTPPPMPKAPSLSSGSSKRDKHNQDHQGTLCPILSPFFFFFPPVSFFLFIYFFFLYSIFRPMHYWPLCIDAMCREGICWWLVCPVQCLIGGDV